MRAKIEETVTQTYFDVPPPSGAFRFSLHRQVGDGWVFTGHVSDCSVENPQTEFEIIESGKYKVICRRLNIFDEMMGPAADSNEVFVGGGEYEAPFRITLGIAVGDDERPF